MTGLSKCSPAEYTGLAGAPLLIYAVRTALDAFFNYRLSGSQAYLNHLNKQRDDAINKLKEATKYNSTQQLLDKYGGQTPTKSPIGKTRQQESTPTKKQQPTPVKRTGIAPPPTANIPGRPLPPSFNPTTPPQQGTTFQPLPPQSQQPQNQLDTQSSFAPNAFSQPRQPHEQYSSSGPRWYDRLLDVVLGDDETKPENRIVLLCRKCRLVNGQAPPGTRTLEDIGAWRCKECGSWNGQENDAKNLIREIAAGGGSEGGAKSLPTPAPAEKEQKPVEEQPDEQDVDDEAEEEQEEDAEEIVSAPAESTRSKVRQRKKY